MQVPHWKTYRMAFFRTSSVHFLQRKVGKPIKMALFWKIDNFDPFQTSTLIFRERIVYNMWHKQTKTTIQQVEIQPYFSRNDNIKSRLREAQQFFYEKGSRRCRKVGKLCLRCWNIFFIAFYSRTWRVIYQKCFLHEELFIFTTAQKKKKSQHDLHRKQYLFHPCSSW